MGVLMSVKTKFGAASKGKVVQDPLVIPEDYRVPAGFFLGECRAVTQRLGVQKGSTTAAK
jgi:hypothetical protein